MRRAELGVELDEHIQGVIDAMAGIVGVLGLGERVEKLPSAQGNNYRVRK